MGEQVQGTIKKANAKEFQWGKKYSFLINSDWYGVFENKIQDPENRELIAGLKEGDEVCFDWEDVKGYKTIVGARKLGESSPSTPPSTSQSTRYEKEPLDTRLRSMALAYVKDLIVADKVGLEDWMSYAEAFYRYINGVDNGPQD